MNFRLVCASLVTLAAGAALYAFQEGMQAAAPSAEHKALHRAVGTWETSTEMAPGQAEKGLAVVELGPGGFSTFSQFKGTMMGMPFEGRGIDGYDPHKKKYVSIWTDSWSPAPMFMEGTWDEKAQTMTMHGDMPGPTGEMVKSKLVTKWMGNDKMDFEMYGPGEGGAEMKMMTIHYTRKK